MRKKMEILLISSYRFEHISRTDIAPPLSLLYLAGSLREAGYAPEILDLNLVNKRGGKSAAESYEDAIIDAGKGADENFIFALSCLTTTHFPFFLKAAQQIKQSYPEAVTVLGGMHPTLFTKDILTNCPEVDFIIVGEGEEQLVKLMDALEKKDLPSLAQIQAFAYRDKNSNIIKNERISYVNDLDQIPMPAWDMVDYSQYYRDHSQWRNPKGHNIKISIPLFTSRSCPYDCSFCSAHETMGRGYRCNSPQRVADEIQFHVENYGHNYFGFADDNLTLKKSHILGICNEIAKRNLDIQFESFNGYNIKSLDDEVVSAMVEAGCVYVILPIEHGNDHMRNNILQKSLPREKIFEINSLYKKHNLLTRGVYIMGFPEETVNTLNDTVNMIKELETDMSTVFTLIPFPGTRLFDQALRDDLLIGEIDVKKLWTGEMALNTSGSEFYIKPYDMTLEQLQEYRHIFDSMAMANRIT